MPAVSRPPDGRGRRVLTSNPSTNNTRSPTLAASKPIRARVDLSSLASPPASPALNSTWTPTQPVRVKAKSTLTAARSAPTTPTVQSTGAFFKPTPTHIHIRAALSPQSIATPTAAGGGGTRAISPQQRARSPDLAAAARTRTTSSRGAQGDLRGQRDPFPSLSSPITHLPASVSVRKLHSPTLRASQRQEQQQQQQQQYLSTSTSSSSASSSVLPPLSTSPSSSIASSPLTSPNLHSLYDPSTPTLSPRLGRSTTTTTTKTTGLGFYEHDECASTSSSIGRKSRAGSSSTGSGAATDPRTTTTTTTTTGIGGLLPAFPSYSSSSRLSAESTCSSSTSSSLSSSSSSSTFPPVPLASPFPTSFSNVAPNPVFPLVVHERRRSPTLLPPSSSTKTLRSLPTNQTWSITSGSLTTSTSIGTEGGGGSFPFPSAVAAASAIANASDRNPLFDGGGTDYDEGDDDERYDDVHQGRWDRIDRSSPARSPPPPPPVQPTLLSSGVNVGVGVGVDSYLPLTTTTATTTPGVETLLRESIEKEIEAKVSRRIMDLEIRTSSLLSINAQLERTKVKQTSEIRELRRKLRESLGGGGGIRRFDVASSSSSSGGEFTDCEEEEEEGEEERGRDKDEDGDGDGGRQRRRRRRRPSQTWEELLESDPKFGHVATLVEGLIKRGKKAVEYEVEAKWEQGRVLSAVELEDRFDDDDDDDDEGEAEVEAEEDEGQSASDGGGSVE